MNKENINYIVASYLNQVSMITQYNWDSDYCKDHIERATETLNKELKNLIDWDSLTLEDIKNLGFTLWDKSGFYLIPLYLLPIIPIGTELKCIDGGKIIYDGNNIDNDTRFGCLAYGLNKIPMPKVIEKLNEELLNIKFSKYDNNDKTTMYKLLENAIRIANYSPQDRLVDYDKLIEVINETVSKIRSLRTEEEGVKASVEFIISIHTLLDPDKLKDEKFKNIMKEVFKNA